MLSGDGGGEKGERRGNLRIFNYALSLSLSLSSSPLESDARHLEQKEEKERGLSRAKKKEGRSALTFRFPSFPCV